jgi:hypothetical protein
LDWLEIALKLNMKDSYPLDLAGVLGIIPEMESADGSDKPVL